MNRFFHISLGTFAIGLFFLLAYQTQSLSRIPPISARIYGSQEVWRGHTAFFRIECLAQDGLSLCAHPNMVVRWYQDQQTALGPASSVTHADVKLEVPSNLPQQAFLQITIQDGPGSLADRVMLPVVAVDVPTFCQGHFLESSDVVTADPHHQDDMRVELYPDTGQIVDGLPAQGLGRVIYRGQSLFDTFFAPQPSLWTIVPSNPPTDLFSWRAPASMRRDAWVIAAPQQKRHVRFFPIFKPKQLLLRADALPFAKAGSLFNYRIEALSQKQGFYVDLWLGNSWVDGCHTDADHPCPLALPKDYTGPAYLDAYRQLVTAQDTRATLLRWAQNAESTPQKDMQALRGWLQNQQGFGAEKTWQPWHQAQAWTWMTRFVPTHAAAPRLYDSYATRQKAFVTEQHAQRQKGQRLVGLWLLSWSLLGLGYVTSLTVQRKRLLVGQGWSAKSTGRNAARIFSLGQHVGYFLALASLMMMGLFIFWLSGHLL